VNPVFVFVTNPAEPGRNLTFFLRLNQQPLPRIRETLDFQGVAFRVTDITHSIDPNPDEHGISVQTEFTPSEAVKDLSAAHGVLDRFYADDREDGPEDGAALYDIEFE
jgi:hypothetical protein